MKNVKTNQVQRQVTDEQKEEKEGRIKHSRVFRSNSREKINFKQWLVDDEYLV
jgi:hypothetical protein